MATVMERDVLIEAAAFTLGVLFRQNDAVRQTAEYKKDEDLISNIRDKYLHSQAENLDWEKEVQLMKEIRAKYGE